MASAAEDRLLIAVERMSDRFDAVGMTEQAACARWADRSEHWIDRTPAKCPTDCSGCTTRSATETAGRRARSGTRFLVCPSRGHILLPPRPAPATRPLFVEPGFAVNHTSTATFDCVAGQAGLECGRGDQTFSRWPATAATRERPMGWRRNVSAISAWQRAQTESPTNFT